MAKRLTLHEELCKILRSRNVYYQPPESVKMQYDAIRYALGAPDIKRASNGVYRNTNRYEGVVISRNPDTTVPNDILSHFEMCSLGKPYVADNLNHYPFTIYY